MISVSKVVPQGEIEKSRGYEGTLHSPRFPWYQDPEAEHIFPRKETQLFGKNAADRILKSQLFEV